MIGCSFTWTELTSNGYKYYSKEKKRAFLLFNTSRQLIEFDFERIWNIANYPDNISDGTIKQMKE